MKTIKYAIVVMVSAFFNSSVFAAGSSNGLVTYLFIHSPGVLMFQVGAGQTSPAACSTTQQWAIDASTTAGKGMFALLLSAQSQGLPVTVIGRDVCDVWGDRESPLYVVMTP